MFGLILIEVGFHIVLLDNCFGIYNWRSWEIDVHNRIYFLLYHLIVNIE